MSGHLLTMPIIITLIDFVKAIRAIIKLIITGSMGGWGGWGWDASVGLERGQSVWQSSALTTEPPRFVRD